MAAKDIKAGQLRFRIAEPDPGLWISRIVLYENTTPLKPLREIKLHRGLNVVWGIDEARKGKSIQPVLGHSVGKTALCRLIRHCLGEDYFADEDTRKAIRATFPKGYVACEVHVAGQQWAVARPMGTSSVSYAKRDCSIEDLLDDRPNPHTFHEYREALAGAMCGRQLRPDLDAIKNWLLLLAWCTRDQEARYESLAVWRSPRSASGTPSFDKPKVEAIQFIRTAAHILSKKELKLQATIEKAEADIEELNKKIEERGRLPDYWIRHHTEELRRLGVEGDGARDTLFQPQNLADRRRQAIADEIQKLEQEIQDLDYQISIAAARLEEADQLLGLKEAREANIGMRAGEATAEPQRLREELTRLKAAQLRVCAFGGLPVEKCSYAKDYLIDVGARCQAAEREAAGQVAVLDQQAAALRDQAASINEAVARLRDEHKHLIDQRRAKEKERQTLEQNAEAISTSVDELDRWGRYLRGDVVDPDWLDLQTRLKTTETELAGARASLAAERQAQDTSLRHARRIFGGLVKSILSREYQGRVQIAEDDLLLRIHRGSRLAGEALQTLSILLADLTCMMLAVEKHGLHPRFLIHDSPREADLGLRIYQNYLSFLGMVHDRTGGAKKAPFQYIVTTTTPPPKEIRRDDRLALELTVVPERLLFTRVLRDPGITSNASDEPELIN